MELRSISDLAERQKFNYNPPRQFGVAESAGWSRAMNCPKCKMSDVYVSQRSNDHLLSFLYVNMRCHRCCHLFSVPRWKAPAQEQDVAAKVKRTV